MKSGKKVNRIVSHFCFKNIVVSYSYNGDGIRYGKTVNGVTTRHVWDGANITADITGAEKTFYARGTGLIFSERDGQKQYYAFNGHGDTVSVTDTQGNLLQGYDYDAFGNEKGTAQNVSNPFRYCGEYYDGETGLIYLRNRYYAPESGRFTQEDPVRDGLNWFIYCNNNPIMFVDPLGLGPNDLFTSIEDARLDFAMNYNRTSIIGLKNDNTFALDQDGNLAPGVEFAARIYTKVIDDVTYYAYGEPVEGTVDTVDWSHCGADGPTVEFIHTHGAYSKDFGIGSDILSLNDLNYVTMLDISVAVVTPGGEIYSYKFEDYFREAFISGERKATAAYLNQIVPVRSMKPVSTLAPYDSAHPDVQKLSSAELWDREMAILKKTSRASSKNRSLK